MGFILFLTISLSKIQELNLSLGCTWAYPKPVRNK